MSEESASTSRLELTGRYTMGPTVGPDTVEKAFDRNIRLLDAVQEKIRLTRRSLDLTDPQMSEAVLSQPPEEYRDPSEQGGLTPSASLGGCRSKDKGGKMATKKAPPPPVPPRMTRAAAQRAALQKKV